MGIGWGYGTEQRLRDENQDSMGLFRFGEHTVAVICDGMGGHAGGAQASSMAVRIIHDKLRELSTGVPIRDALVSAINDANRQIYDTSRRSHRLMGMGTTVVAVAIKGDTAHIAHVGDSRAYLIRGDEATQLTRDHTMVNLFVEAELLSPEDAASHPEAHVLARSLGVERTVDVELRDPLDLQDGDTLVVCSDGVHGILTDWEFGRIGWSSPQQGVRKVLQMVTDREGDDNATVAVLTVGAADLTELPLTEPPELDSISDAISGSSSISQAQDSVSGASRPAPPPLPPLPPLPPREPVRYDAPIRRAPEAPAESSGLVSFSEPAPPPPDAPLDQTIRPDDSITVPLEPKSPSLVRLFLVAGSAAVGVLALTLPVLWYVIRPLLQAPDDDTEIAIVDADIDTQVAEPHPGIDVAVSTEPDPLTQQDPAPDPTTDLSLTPEAAPTLSRFAPDIPPLPPFQPHRPTEYTRKPPGGTVQFNAVQAARNHECAAAQQAVAEAMLASHDYGSLYNQAWYCFTMSHSNFLASSTADTTEAFSHLIRSFQGDADLAWSDPPTDGIEYRLAAWETSTETDLFRKVMLDILGPEKVADQLARDVQLEAEAALWLSRLPEHDAQTASWWARRVYMGHRAMSGAVGLAIRGVYPDRATQIDSLLQAAVPPLPEPPPLHEGEEPPDDPVEVEDPVPEIVREAVLLGRGEIDEPEQDGTPATTTPRPRPKPQDQEPDEIRVLRVKVGAPPVIP